jgi:transcriptional regulator with XRE-family HTH domain
MRATEKALGPLLEGYRRRAGAKPADIAVAAGVSYSYVNNIEKGRFVPTLDRLRKIAVFLKLSEAETRSLESLLAIARSRPDVKHIVRSELGAQGADPRGITWRVPADVAGDPRLSRECVRVYGAFLGTGITELPAQQDDGMEPYIDYSPRPADSLAVRLDVAFMGMGPTRYIIVGPACRPAPRDGCGLIDIENRGLLLASWECAGSQCVIQGGAYEVSVFPKKAILAARLFFALA